MNNSIVNLPNAYNEPIKEYLKGSIQRKLLKKELSRQMNITMDIPLIIDGKNIYTEDTKKAVCPHEHNHKLATFSIAGKKEIKMAIDAALRAKSTWENMPWQERASIFLKAADLISQKYTYILNAATMLNQSKSVFQAEIDSTCELADFLRFNVKFMQKIYSEQPDSEKGIWNRLEYRPLEGFVFALSPFNFTAIAGNLSAAPALMGNTIVWKPSSTSILSGYYLMKIFKEAGLPDGVINFTPGKGSEMGEILLSHPDLAGIHFTGSTEVFQALWKKTAKNITRYKSYPRIVGETGGKNYIFMHSTADVDQVVTASIRGAFEYQGQKCSAASRLYIPESRWNELTKSLLEKLKEIKMGSVLSFDNFVNAVIDERSFDNIKGYINRAWESDNARIIAGGNTDKSTGYFIEPTVILTTDPSYESMTEEIFGPVLTIYVYPDEEIDKTLDIIDTSSSYALTGAVFASDRKIINQLTTRLAHSAGNFYINDKPTGAVVGQQPFGGSRASGTNDKAGSFLNLLRWTSPRNIKETFIPPTEYQYPFMTE
jgi:1-pyrroline-5-carboxylate dehydrogenase